MLSKENVMEILEAYDLTGSFRSTAALCGVDHHTVRRYVKARAAGLDPASSIGRPSVTDPFTEKITEWIERSSGRVRADVVHRKLLAMGFVGSERTTRRVVARLKADYEHKVHRVYKPWLPEPGLWLQFDYGDGPMVAGRHTSLFCAWLSWSRFRVIVPLTDKTFASLSYALDRTLRVLGGVPTYLLTDNERTVTTDHVAGLAVRNREIVGLSHYYGTTLYTCVVADPESKGGSESTVRIAKADVCPRPDNLVSSYADFAALERACSEATTRFNTRVHRETDARPMDRLETEREWLHAVPPHPYEVAVGEARRVTWSSVVSFRGARYSVPHECCEELVYVRRQGDEVIITAARDGVYSVVARHEAVRRGQFALVDAHYPSRASGPGREPRATTALEREFLALGEGARRYLVEAAAGGERRIREKMTEALLLASTEGASLVDEVLGLAALAGRFAPGDLSSIASSKRPLPRRLAEDHSLQPGTSGWSKIGKDQ